MLFSDDEDDDAVAAPAEESSRVALIPPMVFSPALPARMVPHAADQHSASRNIFITFSPDGPTTSPRSSRSTPARDVETVMEAATLEAPCITFSPDEHVGDASGEVAGDRCHDLDARVQPRTCALAPLCAGMGLIAHDVARWSELTEQQRDSALLLIQDNMSKYHHWDDSFRQLAEQDDVNVKMICDGGGSMVGFAAFSVLPVGVSWPRTPLELALAPYIHVRFPVISPCAQDGDSVYMEELHVAQNWQRCLLGSALLYEVRSCYTERSVVLGGQCS